VCGLEEPLSAVSRTSFESLQALDRHASADPDRLPTRHYSNQYSTCHLAWRPADVRAHLSSVSFPSIRGWSGSGPDLDTAEADSPCVVAALVAEVSPDATSSGRPSGRRRGGVVPSAPRMSAARPHQPHGSVAPAEFASAAHICGPGAAFVFPMLPQTLASGFAAAPEPGRPWPAPATQRALPTSRWLGVRDSLVAAWRPRRIPAHRSSASKPLSPVMRTLSPHRRARERRRLSGFPAKGIVNHLSLRPVPFVPRRRVAQPQMRSVNDHSAM